MKDQSAEVKLDRGMEAQKVIKEVEAMIEEIARKIMMKRISHLKRVVQMMKIQKIMDEQNILDIDCVIKSS